MLVNSNDATTPTLLTQFEAAFEGDAVVLRWRFATPEGFVSEALEKAPDAAGPWRPMAVDMRRTGDAVEATDSDVIAGNETFYRLTVTMLDGSRATFGPLRVDPRQSVKSIGLTSIVPNPTSHTARIDLTLAQADHVRLRIMDINGRARAMLVDGPMAAGSHSLTWDWSRDPSGIPPGMYLVRCESSSTVTCKRLVLVR